MTASPALIAIVPAAGTGSRAQPRGLDAAAAATPKQYRSIAGITMLRRAVLALLADARIARVVVAVAPGDERAAAELADLPRVRCQACGGATRAETVAQALAACGAGPEDWVLVHDAARPGLPPDALARLIDACLHDDVGGLLALPVADTVKAAGAATPPAASDAGARASRSVPRDGLWLAQTPQMFPAPLLRRALAHAMVRGLAVTDEASAVEALGLQPRLVRGALVNIKVTWPDDFDAMEKWMA